ncbi:HalOD1 output domain-containing protein [Halomarina salina]|uniref:HalOD1 output domain-containing protein n=1 Tax=Halomarina salina TaxID=1872699 RepID=A0ABD5RS04_9EURY|nr:HalOD1 output domain-containing protein [Halomarina salina]
MSSHEVSYGESTPVYAVVVEAVAAEKGVDPLSLKPPLYDVLDPEALDALYDATSETSSHVQVVFSYADCTVTVNANGTVDVGS